MSIPTQEQLQGFVGGHLVYHSLPMSTITVGEIRSISIVQEKGALQISCTFSWAGEADGEALQMFDEEYCSEPFGFFIHDFRVDEDGIISFTEREDHIPGAFVFHTGRILPPGHPELSELLGNN